ncbi:hypothetical protein [Sphingobacterium rhinopitheci]|uniref:hypothetical protein n=1 Tax=Sphingobacterium rhinopitheci TaxID=2781960 RepID=UPI001F522780|nr:hypothetical protein [Sphingobacterium rhinopitheci]MCI0922281.1 hypothetical protein [Sphingobacterium rhinopitheci]
MKRNLKMLFDREISSNRVDKSFPLFLKKLLGDSVIYNYLFEQFKRAPLIHDFDSYLELYSNESVKATDLLNDFINKHLDEVLDPSCYINNLHETQLIKLSKELDKVFIDMQKYVIDDINSSEDKNKIFDIKQSEVFAYDFYSRIMAVDNLYVREKFFQYFLSEDNNIYFEIQYCINNKYNDRIDSEKWRSLKRNFNLNLNKLITRNLTSSSSEIDSTVSSRGSISNFNLLLKELKRLNLIVENCYLVPGVGKVKVSEAPKGLEKTFKAVDLLSVTLTDKNYLRDLQSDAINEIMLLDDEQLEKCMNRLISFNTFKKLYEFFGTFYVKFINNEYDNRDLFDLEMCLEGYFSVNYPENSEVNWDFVHELQDEISLKNGILNGLIYQIEQMTNTSHQKEFEELKKTEAKASINDGVKNRGRKYTAKEDALAYVFDLYANDLLIPINPIDQSISKSSLIGVGKKRGFDKPDTFYRAVKVVHDTDLNSEKYLKFISKDWLNVLQDLSDDYEKLSKYLENKGLIGKNP